VSGDITIEGANKLSLVSGSHALTGTISGTGSLQDFVPTGKSVSVALRTNTYSGGTRIGVSGEVPGAVYKVEASSGTGTGAFGTGSIYFVNAGTLAASLADRTVGNSITLRGAMWIAPAGVGSFNHGLTMSGAINLGAFTAGVGVATDGVGTLSGVLSNGGLEKLGPGTLNLTHSNSYTGETFVSAGTLNIRNLDALGTATLNLQTSGRAALPDTLSSALKLPGLNVSVDGFGVPQGTLDMFDNDLMIDYISGSPRDTVVELIQRARNDGAWDVAGITSTTAASDPDQITTLGVLEGSEYRSIYGTNATFSGRAVDDTSVLVKYTYYGDSDLDGDVDLDDYSYLDAGLTLHRTGWLNGDYDYSGGEPDLDDVALIDAAYLLQSGTLRPALDALETGRWPAGTMPQSLQMVQRHADEFGDAYVYALFSAVPEPAAMAAVGLLGVLGARPRRHRVQGKDNLPRVFHPGDSPRCGSCTRIGSSHDS
ncbi:MAG: autotransporter-associated beta strand repeat-containing protein, partial [Tepidisphaeraceae bacterium]